MAKILMVDDDTTVLSSLVPVLKQQGHTVIDTLSSAKACEYIENTVFDAAIVDYQMPPPDGLELLRRITDAQPKCLRILMSGCLNLPVVLDAVNRGEVSRVLEKPCRINTFLETVEQAFAGQKKLEQFFADAREHQSKQQHAMLKECLSGGYIRTAIQPIVGANAHEVLAYEALIRSKHAVMDSPMTILAAAEAHQALSQVTAVVIADVCNWLSQLPEQVKVFVNLHPLEFGDPKGLSKTLEPLKPHAARVVFEITERSSVLTHTSWEKSVALIGDMGSAIAVDDLGAGYSSLSVLAELQPQYIKVDMSIVRGIDGSPRKRRLLDLLCRFADTTDAFLIAEGVETQDEARTLEACGAHCMQGYFFGKPAFAPQE